MDWLSQPYNPRGDCPKPMDPTVPRGCAQGFEPYVHRTKKMLETGDVFDPCCKQTCEPDDTECQSQSDTRWIKRMVRFAEVSQHLTTVISRDLTKIYQMAEIHTETLNRYFQEHKDIHEEATELLSEIQEVANAIIRDLNHCLGVITTNVDNRIVVKATIVPSGEAFDLLRAELVTSGCGSVEVVLAVARSEYIPRFSRLAELLNDAVSGYNRTALAKRYRQTKYGIGRMWLSSVARVKELSVMARQLNIRTLSFYALTVVPFLYTSVLSMGVVVPALLLSKDKITMMARCLKIFCNFTQLPGLAVGLGVVLTNKLVVYMKNRQNVQRVDDDVAKGAVTFFSTVESLIKLNPAAAAGFAALGAAKAGVKATAHMAANTMKVVASLGNTPEISFMMSTMQGILMFFMTIMSSSIWEAVGFACKTAATITAPVVEGTASVLQGSSVFFGGLGNLASQLYGATGTTLGYGLGKAGNAANFMGDKLGSFMDSFSIDSAQRARLLTQDTKIESTLTQMNESISKLLGLGVEGANEVTTSALDSIFDPSKMKAIEEYIRSVFTEFSGEIRIMLLVMSIVYGTWTWFQPVTDLEQGLSSVLVDPDAEVRAPTEFIHKYGRIIPRPPANFVYQQCLQSDVSRHQECVERVTEWTGIPQTVSQSQDLPPYAASPSRPLRGSARVMRRRR